MPSSLLSVVYLDASVVITYRGFSPFAERMQRARIVVQFRTHCECLRLILNISGHLLTTGPEMRYMGFNLWPAICFIRLSRELYYPLE